MFVALPTSCQLIITEIDIIVPILQQRKLRLGGVMNTVSGIPNFHSSLLLPMKSPTKATGPEVARDVQSHRRTDGPHLWGGFWLPLNTIIYGCEPAWGRSPKQKLEPVRSLAQQKDAKNLNDRTGQPRSLSYLRISCEIINILITPVSILDAVSDSILTDIRILFLQGPLQ